MYNQRKEVLCYLMGTWICIKLNEEVVRKKVFFLRLVKILSVITVTVGGWELVAVGVGCCWLLMAAGGCGYAWLHRAALGISLGWSFTLVNHGSFKLFRDRVRDTLVD